MHTALKITRGSALKPLHDRDIFSYPIIQQPLTWPPMTTSSAIYYCIYDTNNHKPTLRGLTLQALVAGDFVEHHARRYDIGQLLSG